MVGLNIRSLLSTMIDILTSVKFEISNWTMNVPLPQYAQLKYLNSRWKKLLWGSQDTISSYTSKKIVTFLVFILSALDNVSRVHQHYLSADLTHYKYRSFHLTFTSKSKSEHQLAKIWERQQNSSPFRYTLLGVTNDKLAHFIGMGGCNNHKQDTICSR